MLEPANVFASESRVVDAAEIVIAPPALNVVPFTVPREPVRRFVPIDVVATSFPAASVERSADVRAEKYCDPVVVAFTTSVEDAMSCVPFNHSGVVVLWLATPAYE